MRIYYVVVLIVFLCITCLGCSPGTSPAVTALQAQQEQSLAAYIAQERAAKLELCDQLEEATQAQVELILDHQVDLAGESMATDKLRELLAQYREKREAVKLRMDQIRATLARSDVTAEQLVEVQRKIGEYLAAQKDDLAELRRVLEALKSKGGAE